ncbi:ribose-5-phosphate isomerase B [Clostridium pasteurianum DSM 525 = ATCC 6013]|uniref:Ribose-5-phosphate isomerase B n=1 Tax=Clostridium pasteurianum DSM 525 = ATCC 6013 TaxID=1262449 RepID=A0A0H3IY01_CLOPA|nr:ribose 5-phosphate isomerase B [Clostridium pasteurianum]AJA46371.1 ribose-5-phosphate isomerase B [Clostridium pasteurianum DSM 525 = ATCC 6013]AJA50359.1 ribose-5-phosphate isomerase B [Clostridium pasteurianum DSM 525 = ATCC 6013]AOZ73808.1 ribose 5-phosphate isomerase [Clostridium pasteurianum DSM 525 = ATCC 6013]AOZ77605.1 ribose 5-phosphate isomerase [Clostridium pasteurianum]ELP60946.1 ribose-5-phosphate isomerase B [Clostridium pasteurianum DSM 525 = ATCC 6013]
MKIALGSDHAGLSLKKVIIKHLEEKGVEIKDFGTYTEDSCDYPDYAYKVAVQVADNKFHLGILVCGTGIGISIAANKVKGIRAAACSDTFSAHACREHNNANIIALGERVVGPGLAIDIVDAFLQAKFEGGRHEKRINKISEIESK